MLLPPLLVSIAALQTGMHPSSALLCQRSTAAQMAGGWLAAQEARKKEEADRYRKIAELEAQRKAEREAAVQAQREADAAAKAERDAAMASYLDNVDLSRPGGVLQQPTNVLTRDMLKNSQKVSSPSIDAEARLQQAAKDVGSMSTDDAVALLKAEVDKARSVGVREASPNLKRAVALMGTLLEAQKGVADAAMADPQKDLMDAIFDGGYAMPELDDDDLVL